MTRTVRTIHRWLPILAGVQLLLWLVSGLFMAAWPIEHVRGEYLVDAAPQPVPAGLAAPRGIAAGADGLRLLMQGGRPLWVVTRGEAPASLVDARTLAPVPAPDAAAVAAEARRIYRGDGRLVGVERLTVAPIDYRGPLPVWRARFDDGAGLRLYFAADTGEIKARRTDLWRAYDLMWMLHIMDFRDRESAHNPFVWVLATASILVTLTGLWLLIDWLRRVRARGR